VTEDRLEGFLDRLASEAPTPGAGAATALTAAASAAVVAMVCRVTARRTAPSDDLAQIDQEAETLRARLTALVREDADAFAAVIEARRAPAERRPQAVRAALVRATEVPVEIASAARRILALCDRLVMSARASTVSDLGVAVILAAAALEGAALTARVNLRDLDDPAFVSRSHSQLAKLVGDAAVTRQRLAQVVAARTGIPA
jgi:formiminotetrahydrofolate cyclodeaminase